MIALPCQGVCNQPAHGQWAEVNQTVSIHPHWKSHVKTYMWSQSTCAFWTGDGFVPQQLLPTFQLDIIRSCFYIRKESFSQWIIRCFYIPFPFARYVIGCDDWVDLFTTTWFLPSSFYPIGLQMKSKCHFHIGDMLGITKLNIFICQNYTVNSNYDIVSQSYEMCLVSAFLAYLIIFIHGLKSINLYF